MATVQYYMNYVIFFHDEAEYQFAIGLAGGNLLQMAPRAAATTFGIPYPYPAGDMDTISKGIYFIFPFTPGAQFNFPNPSGIFVDDTVLSTTVPGQAGVPASIWPAGPDGIFTWSANIVKSVGAGAGNSPPANTIAQRRWIGGRETAIAFEGGGVPSTQLNILRDASRTIDGHGQILRGNSTSTTWSRNINEYRTGLTSRTSWERLYIRVRALPTTVDTGIWRCHGTPSSGVGVGLKIRTTGNIDAYGIDAAGTETLRGTVLTPTINQWYRIDIFIRYNDSPTNGLCKIYINGVFVISANMSGFGTGHTSSELGKWTSGTDTEVEVDLDDWINADLPANVDATSLLFLNANYSIDWLLGSHVRLHFSESASQVNWTPASIAKGVENQLVSPDTKLATSDLTSTTSGATLEGLTDAVTQAVKDTLANVLGAAAAIIGIYSRNALGTDGQLGYKKAGAAAVLTTINQLNIDAVNSVSYFPTGMTIPDEIAPWSTVHTKSVDANSDVTSALISVVEYLGVWGPEDDPSFNFPINRVGFLHNCRYPNTTWGYLGSQPEAPVYAVGGTYIGNGSYQEITLPAPCHFLWIRSTGAAGSGIKFFGASLGAHIGAKDRVIPNLRVWFDATAGLFKFGVSGSSAEINQNATTYQYIAFCDPGMRFNICGEFAHGSSSSTPKVNPLIVSDFTPVAGFAQKEILNSLSNTIGLYFRGPGNTGNGATPLDGAAVEPNFGNFLAGIFNSFSALHSGSLSTNYSLWRTSDSGIGGCAGVMVQILSYVGNGTNPRTIPTTPVSGRFPLFVLVCPVTGTPSFFRDPSHAGANSSNVDTLANSVTAITGVGIDSITVNSALNTNGITYNVFIICGDTAGMNNGIFYPTFCDGDGPYLAPSLPIGDINILGNGGLVLNGTTPLTLLKDISGIYTLIPGQRHDTLYDRQTGQPSVNVEIPDPTFKTGYVGG